MTLPTDAKTRKSIPIFSGVLKYFPKTAAAVAKLSMIGNEQHNPGEPLHWARDKSTDQHDTLARHLLEVGTLDSDRVPHDVKVAWRAWAACEEYLEQNPWDESVESILKFIAVQKNVQGMSFEDYIAEKSEPEKQFIVYVVRNDGTPFPSAEALGPYPYERGVQIAFNVRKLTDSNVLTSLVELKPPTEG